MNHKLESRLLDSIDCWTINNLRYADDTTLTAESEEELKSLLMDVKKSAKASLKLNIQKLNHGIRSHLFMANRGGKYTVRFHFIGLQNQCRWWLQSWSLKTLFGRIAMTNLDRVLKSKDITLLKKVCIVKAMVFLVVMYECESGTIKKAECQRIDVFGTVVLEKTLKSHLDSKEIKPVHPKGSQPWRFIGKTDADAEAPIFWPPEAKS